METVIQDIRYGLRMLRKSPGFTAVAMVTLALGIGANTAIFSVVKCVLLKPLPFSNPDRLVNLWESNPHNPGDEIMPVPPADFRDWQDRTHSFAEIGASYDVQKSLTGAGAPEALVGYAFSSNVFHVLGVTPLLGRTFTTEEDRPGAERVVVLAYSLWQRKFGGDPAIAGKRVLLDGESYAVLGVMRPGFDYPGNVEFWVPIALQPEGMADRKLPFLRLVARLKPGVTVQRADADLKNVASQLQREYPQTNSTRSAKVDAIRKLYVGDIQPALLALLGAVGFVLLIACANLASLLLARGASRRKEFAVRSALGASRSRLGRQVLSESLLLSLGGGLLGLLLAAGSRGTLLQLFPNDIANLNIPRLESIPLDGGVIGFAILLSLFTGALFGVLPALHTSAGNVYETLKEGGRSGATGGRERTRSVLVIAEMALSLVLLAGAGLMMKTFLRLGAASLGFNPDHVLTAQVLLPDSKYPKLEDHARFLNETLQRIEALPGVKSAGAVGFLPLSGFWGDTNFTVQGEPAPPQGGTPSADFNVVSPSYFRTMQVPLLAGRGLQASDTGNAPPVAVINQTMARRFWPNQNPVGQHINPDPARFQKRSWEIVGVVGDIKHFGVAEPTHPTIYRPFAQENFPLLAFTIRTQVPPMSLAEQVRQAIWSVDRDQPISKIITMDEAAAESVTLRRISMILLASFAALAVFLAVIGLYGVMAYLVAQRTHEIGVRMALGARPRNISQLVLRQGLRLAAIGIVLGIAAGLGLTRVLGSLLFGVRPQDPPTFVAVAALLAGVALVASYVPARRAMKVDPMVALRYE
ncbi:MAG TPA: ABC transporter permease [Terriglobales bacterium]|nr:ABC transporter permease [Terriglobales bacterium]